MTSFERPRYVAGKLLTADDLELEQRYHIEKRWLLNRIFHGPGIVHGLEVTADPKGIVIVAPGCALDRCGREIEVCEPAELTIPDNVDPASICVVYAEMETDRGTIRRNVRTHGRDGGPRTSHRLGGSRGRRATRADEVAESHDLELMVTQLFVRHPHEPPVERLGNSTR